MVKTPLERSPKLSAGRSACLLHRGIVKLPLAPLGTVSSVLALDLVTAQGTSHADGVLIDFYYLPYLVNVQKCQQFCVFLSVWGAVCTLMKKNNNV